jgi:hypothetical protein
MSTSISVTIGKARNQIAAQLGFVGWQMETGDIAGRRIVNHARWHQARKKLTRIESHSSLRRLLTRTCVSLPAIVKVNSPSLIPNVLASPSSTEAKSLPRILAGLKPAPAQSVARRHGSTPGKIELTLDQALRTLIIGKISSTD